MSNNERCTVGVEQIEAATDISEHQLDRVREAFWDGQLETVVSEHEGSTRTLIFEVPNGYRGLSIGVLPSNGDIHVSTDMWEKEPHHEVDDRWVWVRSAPPEDDR